MEESTLDGLWREFEKLTPREQDTVRWWLEVDGLDKSNPLIPIAELYREEYQKALPKRGGKKAPSTVDRELKEIHKAFGRLEKVLTTDLSPYAQEAILEGAGIHKELVSEWLGHQNELAWMLSLMRKEMSAPGSAIAKLRIMRDLIGGIPRGKPKSPPHRFLVRWTVQRLQGGKRPKSHVLPIARAIHIWAARAQKTPPSKEWGELYLEEYWKK